MELYQHQKDLLDRNPKKRLLAFGTGTGKTLSALELAKKNNVNALIICPKALKPMWERKVKEYTPLQHHVLTKEEFKKQHKDLPRYEAIIADEAHHFSGMTSALSKSLDKYIRTHQPWCVWLLTATPFRSTPWNIYRLAQFLGREFGYNTFKHRFFYEVRMGPRTVPVMRPYMERDIAELVHEIGDVVALEDCADVPEQTFETELLALTKQQVKGIASLEDSAFITRFTHTHCIENGLLNGDGYSEDQTFECNKTERILELVRENKKIAVFCRYNAQIDYYKTILEKEKYRVFVINGAVKDRDSVVQNIEATSECVVLIQAQCSEGYELPSIGVIVFASLSFSYLDYVQALGRFLRINKLKKNHYIHLVIEGGYDQDIYNCIMDKKDFDVAIYEK
jgi:superfamily II DNA or RNA helicase